MLACTKVLPTVLFQVRMDKSTLAAPKLSVSRWWLVPPWCSSRIYSPPPVTLVRQYLSHCCACTRTVFRSKSWNPLGTVLSGPQGLPPCEASGQVEPVWEIWLSGVNCQREKDFTIITAWKVESIIALLFPRTRGSGGFNGQCGGGGEMRAYLQQTATVSRPKWKFHCAKQRRRDGQCWRWKTDDKQSTGIWLRAPGICKRPSNPTNETILLDFTALSPVALSALGES